MQIGNSNDALNYYLYNDLVNCMWTNDEALWLRCRNKRYEEYKMLQNQLSEGWPCEDIYSGTIDKDVRWIYG